MKALLLHSALLVLHAADLWTTSMVTPGREANPLGAMLWIRYGFGALILVKGLVWGAMLAYHLAVQRWLPDLMWVVWTVTLLGVGGMVAVVIWNVNVVF